MTRQKRLILLSAGSELKAKWLEDQAEGWQMDAHTISIC